MQPASTHRESHRRTVPTRGIPARSLIALAALFTLLLAGCGGGSSVSSTAGRATGGATAPENISPNKAPQTGADGAADNATGAKNSAPGAASAPDVSARSSVGTAATGVGPKLTKSASLELRVKSIDAAAARVRAVATGLQAQVLNEQIGTGSPGVPVPLPNQSQDQGKPGVQSGPDNPSGFGTLTLSVPADKLDTALDQLAKIGTVLQRTMSTQDVTAQYVDTQSRLKTMRASVERVRALMAQAKDIGQVVALEGELSQREADLESLESQLAALKVNVERSTLTVALSTPGSEPVTSTGFLAGLRSGWDAFTASVSGLFTGIGAVLPFAIFLALLAAPILWWLRRRRTPRAPAPAPETSP